MDNMLAKTTTHLTTAAQAFFDEAACYLNQQDLALLHQAFDVAQKAHSKQKRDSGEPYIIHPLAVAQSLLGWRMDAKGLAAALLHDVIEDTEVDKASLTEQFGHEIAELVEGLSKLRRLNNISREIEQAKNVRKMILATVRDIRVIVIKLSDRLHNMRTLHGVPKLAKQKRIAKATLEIYAPIAHRIGLNQISSDLQDLSFQYLFPNRYHVIQKALQGVSNEQRLMIEKVLTAIRQKLSDVHIDAEVVQYQKNAYRIYRKMQEKKLSFSEVLDIYSCHIIVNDASTCYTTLGALHSLYKPISGRIKDYIAIPKNNSYQSLHTTLFGPQSMPVEVQIFTKKMYEIAKFGVVAQWAHKQEGVDFDDVRQHAYQWLEYVVDVSSDEDNNSVEFLENFKTNLLPDELYVFTPKGHIIMLPRGATAVDFAYAVSTDMGQHCFEAHINHVSKPLHTILRNGDIVKIITNPNQNHDPLWLNFVVSRRAIHCIRDYQAHLAYKDAVAVGNRLLRQSLSIFSDKALVLSDALQSDYLRVFAPKKADFSAVLADVGMGYTAPIVLVRQLILLSDNKQDMLPTAEPIQIYGHEGGITLASCCRPIPGDEVAGLINENNGLTLHQTRCRHLKHVASDKRVSVTLVHQLQRTYEALIHVLIYNEHHALATIASAISQASANIEAVKTTKTADDHLMHIYFRISVKNTTHLERVLAQVGQEKSVLNVVRR